MAPRPTISEYPTSFKLPPEMRVQLMRHAALRGNLPLGPMLRLVITEWLAMQTKRAKRQKKLEQAQPPA